MEVTNVDNVTLKLKLDALVNKKVLTCVYVEAIKKTLCQDFDEKKQEMVYFYNGDYTLFEETFNFVDKTYIFYSDEAETYNHCIELDEYTVNGILGTVKAYSSHKNSYVTIKGLDFEYNSYKKFKKIINVAYSAFIK